MDDFETELSRMMHATQDVTSLNDDQRARLRGGVRKRRRTRAAWIGGGSVAAVAAVAALAAVLPSASAASPAGHDPAAVADSPTTAPSPAGSGETAWMRDYVLQTFTALLPAGSSTHAWSAEGGVPLHASAPSLTASGKWVAQLGTDLTTPGGRSTTSLTVRASRPTPHCPGAAGGRYDTCSSTSLDGGTLVVDQTFKNPANGTGAALWSVSWGGPDGQLITFGEASAEPHQALTVQQAVTLVTSQAWTKVWQALPAPCRFGAMIAPGATDAQVNSGEGLVCATSRAVALHLPSGH